MGSGSEGTGGLSNDLVALTDAARMLAEAVTLPDIRRVHNLADRLADYAKAARLGLDPQNSAAALSIEAEAMAGELLIRLEQDGTRRAKGQSLPHVSGVDMTPATLPDLGVTRNESSVWQAVARIPTEERAAYVAESRERETEITRAGLIRHAKPSRTAKAAAKAKAIEAAVFTEAEMARRRLEGVVSLELLPVAEKIAADSDYLTDQERAIIEGVIRTLSGAVAHKGLRVVNGSR